MTEQTPIYNSLREGSQDNPYVLKDEDLLIDKNAKAFLTEFPERLYGVEVESLTGELFYETQEYSVKENEFRVDYESKTKAITFHNSQIGKQLNFRYKGTGLSYISPSQIYTELDEDGVMQTLDAYLKGMSKLKNQIENLLEKGSVTSVAGKSGIVTNGDIHLIESVLDANSGNSPTTLPLGVTLFTIKTKNKNYPSNKGFVITYKYSNLQTTQFFYPTSAESTHFRSWIANAWTDWKSVPTEMQSDNKVENSALRSSTASQLVGRAIADVKGLDLSVDLGGLSGQQRLSKDAYTLEFTTKRDSMIDRISFPTNERGTVDLTLSEKVVSIVDEKTVVTYKEVAKRSLYLQPVDVSHLVLLPLEKGKHYTLSLKNMNVSVLTESDFSASSMSKNNFIDNTVCLLGGVEFNGYAYFYDMHFSYDYSRFELSESRFDMENDEHTSLEGRLTKDFGELANQIDFLDDRESTLDLANREISYYSDLGVASNTIPHAFAIDEQRDYIYLYQATGDIPTLSRLSSTGVFLDKMTIPNGKPMKSLGIDYIGGVGSLWVEVGNTLTRFQYLPNGNLNDVTTKQVIKLANEDIRSRFGVAIDNYSNTLSYIVKDEIVAYSLTNTLRGTQTRYDAIKIDPDAMAGIFGFHYHNKTAFILSTGAATNNATYVTTYTALGRELNYKIDIAGDIAEINPSTVRYPRGLQVVKSRTTGKISVVMSITRGRLGFRDSKLYAIHQRFNDVKRLLDLAATGQNYQFTSSAGRSRLIPEGTTKLSTLNKPYHYYITAALAKKITDIPMPTGKHGYFFEVTPVNIWGVFSQVLKRNSQATTQMVFERVIDLSNGTIGRWNLTQGKMVDKISYWGETTKTLSTYRFPVEYYITHTNFDKFTDVPSEYKTGAGYWIQVSPLGTNNAVVQTITRNTLNDFFQAKRVVSDLGVGKFKVL